MIKVLKNGTVITMDLDRKDKYEKKDVVIKDDKIVDIVDNYDGIYDLLIDCKDKIVMPGLINCHTHLGMSIFRASSDNLNLNDWLNKKIWPIENKLTEDNIYNSTLLSCLEMIKTGTTFSSDMYINNEAAIKAYKKSKIRVLYGSCFMDINNKGDQTIESFKKMYNEYKNDKLINFAVAPHAFYTCSKDYLKKCSNLALKYNLPIHMHFCENEDEVLQTFKTYKKDPVDALEECGLLNNKLILAHSCFVSEKGLEKLKNKDVSFVHNIVSNLSLGCGICDICKYKNYVNICLGTDGQGSSNNINMFYHMSLVDMIQKGVYKNPTVLDSYEVLKMATINGAKALGFEETLGSIKVGKKADIIVLDLNNLENYPYFDLISNVVHNVTPINIDKTIINGDLLMDNHKLLLNIDENELKSKINNII